MKIPNVDRAVVEERKLRAYVLSPEHPVGRFKAAFFQSLGFGLGNWSELRSRLLEVAQHDARLGELTEYGQKYLVSLVSSTLTGPTGKQAEIVSVWIVLAEDDIPRFVTVYPR